MRLNVLILLNFSASKCPYFVHIFYETVLLLALIILPNCGFGETEYFNVTVEEDKVVYPDGLPREG